MICVGLNHRTAPVATRERLALTSSELIHLLTALSQPSSEGPATLAEAAILSTCNRFEIYGLASDGEGAVAQACAATAGLRQVSLPELMPYMRQEVQVEAVVRHLLEVAAGLDSMVLGEPQILGQVADAYHAAQAAGTAGPALDALFRQAMRCGKRARSETAIGERAVSISHAAVELARQIFGSLQEREVLVIGAGEMAELAACNLAANGAGRILVVNRSVERAQELAARFRGLAYGWQGIGQALERADIVICSTAAPHAVIRPDLVRQTLALRRQRPLFLIDISVPRNVDPAVSRVPNAYLYDIDDLQAVVQDNLAQRQRQVPQVQAIVDQCTAEYMAWLRSLDVVSTIRDLRGLAERVRDEEIARALRRLGPLNLHQEQVVRSLAHNIVSKLLHGPTVRLKELAGQGNGHRSADMVRHLFDLSPSGQGDGHG